MKIRDCMKKNVYSVSASASVREAVSILVSRHIGLLPVLDSNQRPVLVVTARLLAHRLIL
jgi:CBS domain-containing protein